MTFLEFKTKMFDLACFNIYQVYAWQPDFDRNNLTRWAKKGYLIRLRQGYFAFSEYKSKSDYSLYFVNRIYRLFYISLHISQFLRNFLKHGEGEKVRFKSYDGYKEIIPDYNTMEYVREKFYEFLENNRINMDGLSGSVISTYPSSIAGCR